VLGGRERSETITAAAGVATSNPNAEQSKEPSGLHICNELDDDSSDDEDQERRSNLETASRITTEGIGAWRNRFDRVNTELTDRPI
jgi:hypothetical protein